MTKWFENACLFRHLATRPVDVAVGGVDPLGSNNAHDAIGETSDRVRVKCGFGPTDANAADLFGTFEFSRGFDVIVDIRRTSVVRPSSTLWSSLH